MQVQIDGNELVIRIPIEAERVSSKTGKSITVASSRGCKKTDLLIDGKNVVIGVNAFIPIK